MDRDSVTVLRCAAQARTRRLSHPDSLHVWLDVLDSLSLSHKSGASEREREREEGAYRERHLPLTRLLVASISLYKK